MSTKGNCDPRRSSSGNKAKPPRKFQSGDVSEAPVIPPHLSFSPVYELSSSQQVPAAVKKAHRQQAALESAPGKKFESTNVSQTRPFQQRKELGGSDPSPPSVDPNKTLKSQNSPLVTPLAYRPRKKRKDTPNTGNLSTSKPNSLKRSSEDVRHKSMQNNEGESSESSSIMVLSGSMRQRKKKKDAIAFCRPNQTTATLQDISPGEGPSEQSQEQAQSTPNQDSTLREIPLVQSSKKTPATERALKTRGRKPQPQKAGKKVAPHLRYILSAMERFGRETQHYHNDKYNQIYRGNMEWLWCMSMKMKDKFNYCRTEPNFDTSDEESQSDPSRKHPYALPTVWLKDLEMVMAREIIDKFGADCAAVFGNDEWGSRMKDLLKLRKEDIEWLSKSDDEAETSHDGDDDDDGSEEGELVRTISADDFERGKEFLKQRGLPCERLLARFVRSTSNPSSAAAVKKP